MAWSRVKSTGHGSVAWRVSIEGFPWEPVSHASMETTGSDGRVRYVGLLSDGFKFAERVDLARAKWEPDGFSVKIADVAGKWTEAFTKLPTAVTYLNGDLSKTETTSATVASTTGFASSGYAYVGGEVIAYTGTTGTTFTTLTRGRWDTLAQKHYKHDGELLSYVEVTDWPVSIEGKRVTIYAYGAGDTKTGDGTRVWSGVVSTQPRYNGSTWSFGVDPLSSIFDVDLAAGLKEPMPIRGIYYPADDPLVITIQESADSGRGGSVSTFVSLALAGFWEAQADFCTDLTTQIAAAVAAASPAFTQTNIYARPLDDSWCIEYSTAASSQRYIQAYGPLGPNTPISSVDGAFADEVLDSSGANTSTVSASQSYRIVLSAAEVESPGSVPRASVANGATRIGRSALSIVAAGGTSSGIDSSTYPPGRIYLGGTGSISSAITAAQVDWTTNGSRGSAVGDSYEVSATIDVTASSAASRYIEVNSYRLIPWSSGEGDVLVATAANVPEIKVGLDYGTGDFETFLNSLTSLTPDYVNTGATPDVRSTDFTTLSATDLREAISASPFASNRSYRFFETVSLKDVIEQECRLIGVYPCMTSSGTITFKKVRFAAESEAPSATVTATTAITDNGWLSYEQSALGIFATVKVSTGYDALDGSHKGTEFLVRDVSALSRAPRARVLDIAPLSGDPPGPIRYDDIVRLATRTLGVFAGPYAYLTLDVPLTLIDRTLGDVVSVTWSKVPNGSGTLSVTDKRGLLVSRQWDPMDARGTITLLVTDQRIGGYVPSARITGISGTSGTTGPFTITISTDYLPSGTTAADFWDVGDKIRLYEWGSTTTANNVTADVTSAVGTSIVFTADSAWTHAGATWAVGSQVSTSVSSANQKRFVYIANADGTLDWSGSTGNPPFTMAP